MRKLYLGFLMFLFVVFGSFSQAPEKATSGDIHAAIKKLNFLGAVLYLAAHPDDENTRLIAYMSNDRKANTAYLSLTRGDGGQNLIGTEIRESLGMIRTQELLKARSIDGGTQYFTRANDFGYSKHPAETFTIWNKDQVLADVVWVIRNFKPDVVINRFDHRSPGSTHGHHTGSAMVSFEAFDLAGDKTKYPEQLKSVSEWKPQRLFFNTSWWFYGSKEKFKKADKTNLYAIDIGTYYPLKGKSNNEIAAEARSMHKSQGFGASGSRGSYMEYMEFLKGDRPKDKSDVFSGINTTWTRVKKGKPIGDLVSLIDAEFDADHPEASLPDLLKAYKMISNLEDGHWKNIKLKELTQIISDCAGLYLEVVANDNYAAPSTQVTLQIEAISRLVDKVKLDKISLNKSLYEFSITADLKKNRGFEITKEIKLPSTGYSNAYWLNEKGSLGMYKVNSQELIGLPETPRALQATFYLKINEQAIAITKDVVFKLTDPVKGEVYKPFEITPPVFVNVLEKVSIFPSNESKEIMVRVKAGKDSVHGEIKLELAKDWIVSPQSIPVQLESKGEERVVKFTVSPPANQSEQMIIPVFTMNEKSYSYGLTEITYDHIPHQMIVCRAEAKLVKLNIVKRGSRVGYIMGAGDEVPGSLRQIGYHVELLKDEEINFENLTRFDAVILGIRAYNTNDKLKFHQGDLYEYVKRGGTMLVQYNTNRGLKVKNVAPYPIRLSKDRVTVENAPVRIIKPNHEVLNYPNKITAKDFEGWVQERGLYFPNKWDAHFEAVLSSNDPGEKAKNGGLLIAKYGQGYFIYTGYSWFRELPAGVPGAYRLFANLISIGKNKVEQKNKD